VVRLEEYRREELRALLALGLLAVLWGVQGRFDELAKSGSLFWEAVSSSNYLLTFLWGAYAFLMILGWSDDFLPKRLCHEFKSIARGFLQASFVIITLMFGLAFYLEYENLALVAMAATVVAFSILIIPTGSLRHLQRFDIRKSYKKLFSVKTYDNIFAFLARPVLFTSFLLVYYGVFSPSFRAKYGEEGILLDAVYMVFIALMCRVTEWSKNKSKKENPTQSKKGT